MMNWFYTEAGEQRGPVTQEEFDQLLARGTITDSTLVWREGLPGWEPWSALKPIGVPPPAAPAVPPLAAAPVLAPGRVRCAECGGEFAADDTIHHGERHICAACKPRFLQRLNEGASPGTADGQYVSPEAILARDYAVDIGRCFDRARKLFSENMGLLLGAMVVSYGIQIGVQLIPLLGYLAPIFLSGPLTGGLILVNLKRLRGQPAEVGGVFAGFGPRYWQLVLVQFIQSLIVIAVILPVVLFTVVPFAMAMSYRTGTAPSPPVMLFVGAGLLLLLAVPVLTYLSVSWIFSLSLVADKGLEFWPAMELSRKVVRKHWWAVFGLLLVAMLLIMAGALLCGVGALFTAPIAIAMVCQLYQDIFADLAPQTR